MSKMLRADLVFLWISLTCGISFPLIRTCLEGMDAYTFVAVRFVVSVLFFLPFIPIKSYHIPQFGRTALQGIFLGFVLWVGYFMQTVSLKTLPSGRVAFISSTSVFLVPLLSPLFGKKQQDPSAWVSAIGAAIGLYFLTDPSGVGVTTADLFVSICALSVALHTHFNGRFLERGADPTILSFFQTVGVALFGVLVLPFAPSFKFLSAWNVWIALIMCAVLSTVLAFILQAKYQTDTTPEKIALIFALEPVFAAILGYFIHHEILSPQSLMGCGIILASLIGNEVWKLRAKR